MLPVNRMMIKYRIKQFNITAMKRLLIPIVTCCLAMLVSSCSTGTNEQTGNQPADTVQSAAAPATEAAVAADSVNAATEKAGQAGEQEEEKEKDDKD